MKIKTTIKRLTLVMSALLLTLVYSIAQEAMVVEEVATTDLFGRRTQDLSKLPKMERDIVILQNVLNDLMSSDRNLAYSARGSKGMYIPGKGVIFNVSYRNRYGNILFADDITIVEGKDSEKADPEEQNKKTEETIEELSKDFLVNYGSILSELKSGEKVMLNVEYSQLKPLDKNADSGVTIKSDKSASTPLAQTVYLSYAGKSSNVRMVSSINYSDIESFLNGKLSLEQAKEKVATGVDVEGGKKSTDAKIMAGILDDLFQTNLDGNYRRSRKTTWTYFSGFGLMYDLNLSTGRRNELIFYSRGQNDGAVGFVEQTDDDKKKEREELDKALEENIDEIIDMAQESIITYGRTLRSVKSDEVVILNINLGGVSSKSKLPKSIRIQVSKSQIETYSRGQKSLQQLKQEIDIKKLTSSTNGSPVVTGFVNQGQSIYSTSPTPRARTVRGTRARGRN